MNLDVQNMEFVEDKVIFKIKKLLKPNRVGDPLDSIELRRYPECKRLCLIPCLKAYLAKTQLVRGYSQLLLSYVRPFKSISRDNLARWTLSVMHMAAWILLSIPLRRVPPSCLFNVVSLCEIDKLLFNILIPNYCFLQGTFSKCFQFVFAKYLPKYQSNIEWFPSNLYIQLPVIFTG